MDSKKVNFKANDNDNDNDIEKDNLIPKKKNLFNLNTNKSVKVLYKIQDEVNLNKISMKEKLKEKVKTKHKIKFKNNLNYMLYNIQEKTKSTKKIEIDIYNHIHIFGIPHEFDFQSDIRRFILIDEDSTFVFIWTCIIIFIMAYYIMIFPFENFSEKWLIDHNTVKIISIILEIIFLFDIYLNFVTTVKIGDGNIQLRSIESISLNYLSTWFITDAIASVPVETLSALEVGIFKENMQGVVFAKLLKLPRFLKILRILFYNLNNKYPDVFGIENYIYLTPSEINMYNNLFKEILIFVILVTYLVCYKAGLASLCSYDNCQNWFYDVTTVEYCNALFYPLSNKYGEFVAQITPNVDSLLNQACPDSIDSNILIDFYNKLYSDRLYLYANALYFVIQTITTVGYGDVSAYSTYERMYNIACMVIGVMLFNIASAAFLEFTVYNNDNIFKDRSREDMIEKMQIKYLMNGKAKKFIKLLADSAYSDNLVEEVEFARRLPKYMCETVLNHMFEIYNNRLNIFKNEKLEIFTSILDCSSFKRCIPDECLLTENGKISVVYSGQLGVKVTNVSDYIHYDYVYKSKIGDEFGLLTYLDYKNYQFTIEHLILCNSEIIEIDCAKYMDIMSRSNKGLTYIYSKLYDKVFNLYILLSLYYGMILRGMYIDSAWYNKTISLLNVDQEDYIIFNELVSNFSDFKRDFYIEYGLNDWYFSFVDQKSRKHFGDKAMLCIDNHLKPEFRKLRECKFEFNEKMKISQHNEDDSKPMLGKFSEIKIFGN